MSFTEHHCHAEGFEVSNDPVLLDLYVGLQTKCVRVGQLGIVLPAANPIRVAEDIAPDDRYVGRTLTVRVVARDRDGGQTHRMEIVELTGDKAHPFWVRYAE